MWRSCCWHSRNGRSKAPTKLVELEREAVKTAIRAKIVELARASKMDATSLADSDIVPASGLLDSTAILELVAWYEQHFDIALAQSEINIDNLGSIDAMADFLLARKARVEPDRA
jgi:D-alanine--poly(phosphoribitol) ligase subunit 2